MDSSCFTTRSATILSTILSTITLISIVVVIPLFFVRIQKSNSMMVGHLVSCQSESHELLKELSRSNHRRSTRQADFGSCCSCGQGKRGEEGQSGKDGEDGHQGRMGANGRNGRDGQYIIPPQQSHDACQKCPSAPPGPPGTPGQKGPRGPSGKPGRAGPDGIAGRVGPPGPEGIRGPPGNVGYPGARGDGGRVLMGAPSGPRGPSGPIGPRGKAGVNGHDGQNGMEGMKGERGRQGERGEGGKNGITGHIGTKGSNGISGSCSHCSGEHPSDTSIQSVSSSPGRPLPSSIQESLFEESSTTGGGTSTVPRQSTTDAHSSTSTQQTTTTEESTIERATTIETTVEYESGERFYHPSEEFHNGIPDENESNHGYDSREIEEYAQGLTTTHSTTKEEHSSRRMNQKESTHRPFNIGNEEPYGERQEDTTTHSPIQSPNRGYYQESDVSGEYESSSKGSISSPSNSSTISSPSRVYEKSPPSVYEQVNNVTPVPQSQTDLSFTSSTSSSHFIPSHSSYDSQSESPYASPPAFSVPSPQLNLPEIPYDITPPPISYPSYNGRMFQFPQLMSRPLVYPPPGHNNLPLNYQGYRAVPFVGGERWKVQPVSNVQSRQ